jgi:precorrin-6B methylase 1
MSGQLTCVGTGMMLGAHLSPRARHGIESADVVFVLVADVFTEHWVMGMNANVRSLQPYYAEGKDRSDTYREMVAAMLAEVRAGKNVCGAFYGHPGVFAGVPHRAIAQAREEGFEAVMEPGISAEGALYADLGLDPGAVGCTHMEASQFLFFQRVIDPSAWLVLWQVALAGDRSYKVFASSTEQRQALVDKLRRTYPAEHGVILYEAATLAISPPRLERLPLCDLANARLEMHTTLVIPPSQPLRREDAA